MDIEGDLTGYGVDEGLKSLQPRQDSCQVARCSCSRDFSGLLNGAQPLREIAGQGTLLLLSCEVKCSGRPDQDTAQQQRRQQHGGRLCLTQQAAGTVLQHGWHSTSQHGWHSTAARLAGGAYRRPCSNAPVPVFATGSPTRGPDQPEPMYSKPSPGPAL